MTTTTATFYAFEFLNETAVGPFATRELATAWMTKHVPPEDIDGSPENATSDCPSEGYRVGDLAAVNEQLSSPIFESPADAAARYAECYAEYYPNFKFVP